MDLHIRDVVKIYGNVRALKGVSLDIPAGSLVTFLGPSGCGKTTLLRVIAGLEQAEEGEIRLGGNDLAQVPARNRNFGMVFQSYSLFPNMTAARNVGYGLECRGRPKAEIASRAAEMLKMVHLSEHAHKYPTQLSGGQQQRIALARALAVDPALLLLDESLSALDAKVREDLRVEIRDVQRRLGITTIMVTHDQDEALAMADFIVVMRDGGIEQVGTPTQLYTQPATAFVASFIGRMNFLDVSCAANGSFDFWGRPFRIARDVPAVQARLGIRPERVRLQADEAGENVAVGTVRQVVYLGNLLRLVVMPDHAPGSPIMLEQAGGGAIPEVGARVALHLPADALQVMA